MKVYQRLAVATAGFALSLAAIDAKPAVAADFTFTQEGFSFGGTLSGSFSGTPEANGLLLLRDLTSFQVTWSGNPYFPEFTLNLPDFATFPTDNFTYYSSSYQPIPALGPAGPTPGTLAFNVGDVYGAAHIDGTFVQGIVGRITPDGSQYVAYSPVRKSVVELSSQPVPEPPLTILGTLVTIGIGWLIKRKVAFSQRV